MRGILTWLAGLEHAGGAIAPPSNQALDLMAPFHPYAQPFWRRLRMRRKLKKRKTGKPKTRLGLPDLDQSKAAVIGSLRSHESQRGYTHAIDEFIEWYCSEPRLSFNRTVVLRYRITWNLGIWLPAQST
jgi:hypothetical protein